MVLVPATEEFQVVLLAGGGGRRLTGITPSVPKPMVPIANRPMVWYALKNIEHCLKLKSVLVVTVQSYVSRLQKEIESSFAAALPATRTESTTEAETGVEFISLGNETEGKGTMHIVLAVLPTAIAAAGPASEEGAVGSDDESFPEGDDDGEDDEEELVGTAEALKLVASQIQTDFVVMSCDLVGEVDVQDLLQRHRIVNAACSVLLLERCGGVSRDADTTWIALDGATQQVLSMKDGNEVAVDGFNIDKLQMFRHPHATVRTDLQDAHLYVFSVRVRDWLLTDEAKHVDGVRSDLVPHLAKMQSCAAANAWAGSKYKISAPLNPCGEEETTPRVGRTGTYSAANPPPLPGDVGTRVLYTIRPSSDRWLLRTNNERDYLESNLRFCVPKPEELMKRFPEWMRVADAERPANAQQMRDSVVGGGADIEKGVIVKKSVIGHNVVLHTGAKLSSCVIMDNTVIEKDATLSQCIVCEKATIGANCKLNNCKVEANVVVPKGTTAKDEFFQKEKLLLES